MLICIETAVHLHYDMTHLLIDCSESVKIQPTYVLGLLHMTQFSPLLLVVKRCSVCIQKGCSFSCNFSEEPYYIKPLLKSLQKFDPQIFFTLPNIVLKYINICTRFDKNVWNKDDIYNKNYNWKNWKWTQLNLEYFDMYDTQLYHFRGIISHGIKF